MRRVWTNLRRRFRSRDRVHFLHIGKTGGTAIKAALGSSRSGGAYVVVLHQHRVTLRDIPAGDRFMFVIRDPISRFVSAFHSRRRRGRPRYLYPWSEAERRAFATFATPNELALALRSDCAATRGAAETAMRSIRHVRSSYWDWFENEPYLRSRVADLFFVARLDTLSADFERLRAKLGLPETLALPEDDVVAHRAPSGLDAHLDPAARETLRRWYAADHAFIELCDELAPAAAQVVA